MKALNQGEREPLAVQDQVVQLYAATNGFVDRLHVERVPEFLTGLIERLHGQHEETRAKIAGGDWSQETQDAVNALVDAYAQDFGYDLDEEGQPLEDELPTAPAAGARSAETAAEKEPEPQPA